MSNDPFTRERCTEDYTYFIIHMCHLNILRKKKEPGRGIRYLIFGDESKSEENEETTRYNAIRYDKEESNGMECKHVEIKFF